MDKGDTHFKTDRFVQHFQGSETWKNCTLATFNNKPSSNILKLLSLIEMTGADPRGRVEGVAPPFGKSKMPEVHSKCLISHSIFSQSSRIPCSLIQFPACLWNSAFTVP